LRKRGTTGRITEHGCAGNPVSINRDSSAGAVDGPEDSRATIGIADAPGLIARDVSAVFGWRGPCGVVVPDARSAEGVLSAAQEDACRSK
jgi:hypothetical protein